MKPRSQAKWKQERILMETKPSFQSPKLLGQASDSSLDSNILHQMPFLILLSWVGFFGLQVTETQLRHVLSEKGGRLAVRHVKTQITIPGLNPERETWLWRLCSTHSPVSALFLGQSMTPQFLLGWHIFSFPVVTCPSFYIRALCSHMLRQRAAFCPLGWKCVWSEPVSAIAMNQFRQWSVIQCGRWGLGNVYNRLRGRIFLPSLRKKEIWSERPCSVCNARITAAGLHPWRAMCLACSWWQSIRGEASGPLIMPLWPCNRRLWGHSSLDFMFYEITNISLLTFSWSDLLFLSVKNILTSKFPKAQIDKRMTGHPGEMLLSMVLIPHMFREGTQNAVCIRKDVRR